MIQTRYVKYGTISGLLLLATIILSTTEDSHRLVFAQITPAPEKAGGSSSDTDGSTSNDDSSGSSSDSTDSEDSSSNEDSNDSLDTVDSSGGQETTEEPDNDMTESEEEINPLLDAIVKKVTDELTAAGITDLGF
jgi:cytoskeletal protein RodZ